ncbi:MAG: MGMT family protein [Candidatus Kapabacteria bacterium]|nr:MGMT family protein [Candidatus Kapabacteria bacterium]
MKTKTSWKEKLEKPQEIKIVDTPEGMQKFGTGKMLIATPKIIDDFVRKIPKGQLITISEIRKSLAEEYNADVTCPLTTGIFLRISAEAAEEDRASGKRNITPYWRVVRDNGCLIDKFPGGQSHQAELLEKEGFKTKQKGKNLFVVSDKFNQ